MTTETTLDWPSHCDAAQHDEVGMFPDGLPAESDEATSLLGQYVQDAFGREAGKRNELCARLPAT